MIRRPLAMPAPATDQSQYAHLSDLEVACLYSAEQRASVQVQEAFIELGHRGINAWALQAAVQNGFDRPSSPVSA